MESELLPCPWCNALPNSGCNYGIGGAYVNCVNRSCLCNPEIFIAAEHNPDASLSLPKALKQAKTGWNTRAALPERKVDGEAYRLLKEIDDDLMQGYSTIDGYYNSPLQKRIQAALQSHESGLPERCAAPTNSRQTQDAFETARKNLYDSVKTYTLLVERNFFKLCEPESSPEPVSGEQDNWRADLCNILHPGGVKHPQQGDWEWMIKRVKELASTMRESRLVEDKLCQAVGFIKALRDRPELSERFSDHLDKILSELDWPPTTRPEDKPT